jgi:hypothetical protein
MVYGGDKIKAESRHEFAGAANHHRMAVDARVHRAAETVRRVFNQSDFVVGEVNDVESHAKRRGSRPCGLRIEKRRHETDGLDNSARALKHADGQLAVEPAAHQTQSLARDAA